MTRRLSILVIGLVSGCVAHEQRQYFEVVDPESGNVNYYRMSIRGGGGLGVDYQLQAGYFSAASVDVLRGRMPDLPEVDLPVENDEVFETLTRKYYEALSAMSDDAAVEPGCDVDETVLRRARLVWFGQLSTSDVAAMGMSRSTNPFEFRRLVFWASANNIDLRAYGSEIDAMLDSATTLIRASKTRKRQGDQRRRGTRKFIDELIRTQPALAPSGDAVKALLGGEE
mgnify:CR=1 FL=1